MQFDTVDFSVRDPSMRLIDFPGLADSTGADLHLSRFRAHVTLDISISNTKDAIPLSRSLRRVDYSNSLLVTEMMKLPASDAANNSAAASATPQEGDEPVRAVTLQRLKGLFETEPCRSPFEMIEALLQPSCLTMQELDGEVQFPTSLLVTLTHLYDTALMSRQMLVRYLRSRAALFCPIVVADSAANSDGGSLSDSAPRDYYVRFLESSMLKSAVIDICKFLNTVDDEDLFGDGDDMNYKNEDDDDDHDDHGEGSRDGAPPVAPTQAPPPRQTGAVAVPKDFVAAVTPLVAEHFSSAQFPIIYQLAWHYMTAASVSGVPPAKLTGDTVAIVVDDGRPRLNLARIVPIVAQGIILTAGELTKQSLDELWESCTSQYPFIVERTGGDSGNKNVSSPTAPAAPSSSSSGAKPDETLLHGHFALTQHDGVVHAPMHSMPFNVVARINHLFRISNKWNKVELYAYLLPIGDSKKAVDAVLSKRCRDVKEKDGNVVCYIV